MKLIRRNLVMNLPPFQPIWRAIAQLEGVTVPRGPLDPPTRALIMAGVADLQAAVQAAQLPTDPIERAAAALKGIPGGELTGVAVAAFTGDLRRLLPGEDEDPQAARERLAEITAGGKGGRGTIVSSRHGLGIAQLFEPIGEQAVEIARRWFGGRRERPPTEPDSCEGAGAPPPPLPTGMAHLVDDSGYLRIVPESRPKIRVTDLLGRGAMGVVLLGVQEGVGGGEASLGEGGGRLVAVKIIRRPRHKEPAVETELVAELREFLRRELAFQGDVHGEDVVEVYDKGELPDGSHYLVLEYVPGQNLYEWLQKRDFQAPMDLLRQICLRVVAAGAKTHRRGIVHRDIKPENIFIVEGDAARPPQVHLGDFGIAIGAAEALRVPAEERSPVGTALYMPNEVILGTGPYSFRSDVHAFGVMLYEILTGRHPWKSDVSGLTELAHEMLAHPNPPPPSRFNRDVPMSWDAAILRAIRLDPKERQEDTSELLFDLAMGEAVEKRGRAEEMLAKIPQMTAKGRRQVRNTALDLLRAAITAAEAVLREFPDPRIQEWITQTSTQAYELAETTGNLPAMKAQTERVKRLAPGSVYDATVSAPTSFSFFLDPVDHPALDWESLVLAVFEEGGRRRERGKKVWEGSAPRPGTKLDLDLLPGPYSVRMTHQTGDIHPVQIPLPPFRPRTGRHSIRLPTYPRDAFPQEGDPVIMTAGYAVYAVGAGSFAEVSEPEYLRQVGEDWVVYGLVTHGMWYRFVREVFGIEGPQAAASVLPTVWDKRGKGFIAQGRMDLATPEALGMGVDLPVTGMTQGAAEKYLDYAARIFRILPEGVGLLDPDAVKRLVRGNDARRWPDRDETPEDEIGPDGRFVWSGFNARFDGSSSAGRVLPNRLTIDGQPVRDLPAFAVTLDDGQILGGPWVTTNVAYLVDCAKDPARFARAVFQDLPEREAVARLQRSTLYAGNHFDDPHPGSANILRVGPINFRHAGVGIRPAKKLRQAPPTPTLESLT